ncbi:MAG TPA: hypothetical protein VLA19_31915 [Herpetosiphonaceae bacterium]|nr:hypothetical protein [Herpetosiphonaceae bacterium]
MNRRPVPSSMRLPRPQPPLPKPPPTILPSVWRQLDPRRQHRLAYLLATLIRQHCATDPHKEMNYEQFAVDFVESHH